MYVCIASWRACEKKIIEKKIRILKNTNFLICLSYVTHRVPIQPIRYSRLAGQRERIYECVEKSWKHDIL